MSKILKTFSVLSLLTFFMSEGMQTNDQSVDDRRLVPYANNPVSESLVKLGILGKIKHIDVADQYFGTNTPPWTKSNSICYRAFFNYSRTTEIFIPFGIGYIGDEAFDECKNLRSLCLSPSVLFLARSFLSSEEICKGNDNLISVTVPEHLKRYFDLINRGRNEKIDAHLPVCEIKTIKENNIGGSFFYTDQLDNTNTNNKKLQVPEGTVVIMPGIFDACPDVEEVHIPKSVTCISDCSFEAFANLKKVNIGANSSLREIGTGAFYATTIESIFIPRHVIRIRCLSFVGNISLRKVEIDPDSKLETIEGSALSFTNIENIIMPSTLNRVERYAFANSGLRSGEFLSDDITIDNNCFSHCENLTILSFPNVVRVSLGKDSFNKVNKNFSLFTAPKAKVETISRK